MENKRKKLVLDIFLIIVLALLSIYPAFTERFFNVSWDGIYHLTRFEDITKAFSSNHVPSLFNFQYKASTNPFGVAVNAFYPWVSGLIFIVPELIFSNPLFALKVGFFLLNAITILNIKLLVSEFSNKNWPVWVGVVVYQFNNYHFIDLYSRVALGESLAYAFFPLVLLGLIKIHKQEKSGVLFFSLGMGLIAASHVLSLFFAVVFVVIYEIVAFINRRTSLKSFAYIFFGGIFSLIISAYTLLNIASMYMNTQFQAAATFIVPLEPGNIFNLLLSNDLSEKGIWIYGLPLIIFQVYLTIVALLQHNKKQWHSWILTCTPKVEVNI
ncbi:glycosyltransferase family protein [Fructobacillus ficulneus]|uniref:Uncharacterized protein n=1 Tax=Fructobacillus ficulneus TaxID=157463 RepID=A0A0K8MF57_9LACO|nr:hypothetical protein [Fructobacillus ficulneus]GAO99117.1 hypothetical protein FFIC_010220 [Fructobacillus ficulneus]